MAWRASRGMARPRQAREGKSSRVMVTATTGEGDGRDGCDMRRSPWLVVSVAPAGCALVGRERPAGAVFVSARPPRFSARMRRGERGSVLVPPVREVRLVGLFPCRDLGRVAC